MSQCPSCFREAHDASVCRTRMRVIWCELLDAATSVLYKTEEACVCPAGEVSAEGRRSALDRLDAAITAAESAGL